jgi:DNA polymerase-3 subunit gamma/tau
MRDLTRQYRPDIWDSIVGQSVLVKTLQKEIETNTVGQAYLFSGGHGTGKTTTARVFANALNAQIIELDAASNNGVESIRELRNDVLYQPADGKSLKVYIIDEFHMVTTAGQNAFLKVLEEPPAHVIFILATTDPQKILPTIMSRVQRFELKRISEEDIINRLVYIADREKIQYENDALEYIARSVNGGMRDAIKLLQKCSSIDEIITRKTVIDALGSVDPARLKTLVDFILSKNISNTVNYFNKLVSDGVDIKVLFGDMISYLTEEMRKRVINQDPNIGAELDLASKLADFLSSARNTTQLKVLAELKLIQLCSKSVSVDSEIVTDQTSSLPSIPVSVDQSKIDTLSAEIKPETVQKIKEDLEASFKDKFDILFMQIDSLKYKR